jgi:hypothetical protein
MFVAESSSIGGNGWSFCRDGEGLSGAAGEEVSGGAPETTRETEQHKSWTAFRGLGACAPRKSLMIWGLERNGAATLDIRSICGRMKSCRETL